MWTESVDQVSLTGGLDTEDRGKGPMDRVHEAKETVGPTAAVVPRGYEAPG